MDAAGDLEKGLILVGATAIEDQLQENVPQVIADFIRASCENFHFRDSSLDVDWR